MFQPVILLTTTVHVIPSQQSGQYDPSVRKLVYLSTIRRWLSETKFDIVVVENSGYKFEEIPKNDRLEIVSFCRFDMPPHIQFFLDNNPDKGNHEMYAIDQAINRSKKLRECEFFIKVTGRYFVPELKNLPSDIDFVAQSDSTRCEILGCRRSLATNLFYFPSYDAHVEETYAARLLRSKDKKIFRLPLMSIPPTQMGSGAIVNTL